MTIYYKNHLGSIIDLNSENVILQYQEFFDYYWDIAQNNKKISGFCRDSATIPVTIAVIADDTEEYLDIIENFYRAIETDIQNEEPGRLYVGEYYLLCYISGDKKEDAFLGIPSQIKNLTIVTDYPFWCRDKTYHFFASPEQIIDANTREEIDSVLDNSELTPDYPYEYTYGFVTKYKPATKKVLYDYKYDYFWNHTIGKLDNDHFAGSNFKIIIYGPCTHPEIRIGGNIYRVSATLSDGEYMVIDSRNRTVVKYAINGIVENKFNSRDKENNVFKKIPPGKNSVKWNAQYPFDVILLQERSMPKWIML